MAKVAGGIVFGLGLLTFAVVARQDQAHATPGSGCKQWAVQAYRAMSDETLPEGQPAPASRLAPPPSRRDRTRQPRRRASS